MKNNRNEVEQIIRKESGGLRSFIHRWVRNDEDAEDVMQDVFYRLVRAVDIANRPIENVTAWLYRVAKNIIINRSKKLVEDEFPTTRYKDDGILQDFSEVLWADDSPDPDTVYLRSLVWEELEQALAELPSEQCEAFCLTELNGLSAKEAAEQTNVSLNTFLSRKHYAVKFLRIRLSDIYRELIEH